MLLIYDFGPKTAIFFVKPNLNLINTFRGQLIYHHNKKVKVIINKYLCFHSLYKTSTFKQKIILKKLVYFL